MNGFDISNMILLEKHIRAGIKAYEDEHWLMLYNGCEKRIATFSVGTDREHIHNVCDRYLREIDYHE